MDMSVGVENVIKRVARKLSPKLASELYGLKEKVMISLSEGLREELYFVDEDREKRAPVPHSATLQTAFQPENDLNHPDVNKQTESVLDTNEMFMKTIENKFDSGQEQKESATQVVVLPNARSTIVNMFFDAECLVIASYSQNCSVRAAPKLETDLGGREEEVLAVSELLARARYKELTSLVPFPVKGSGRLVKVWVDDEKVSHSKEFYLTLMEDFMKQCKTPAAVIWYTGHGEDATGNWCFRDGTICFREMFDLYQTHFKHKLLYIISDCSYSGSWIQDMANMLDDMGIPPCGHPMREQGILLKLWTSCSCYEQAAYLQYVREGVAVANDGTLLPQSYKIDKLRNARYLYATDLTCPSRDFNICMLDSKSPSQKWEKWKYRAKIIGSLVYLVRGKDKGKPAWHYVLVEEDKLNMFKDKVESGTIDVAEYGVVLKSGWGKDPPDEVKSAIDSFFSI